VIGNESGGIVLAWLGKVILVSTIFGVLLLEGGAALSARLAIADAATGIATEASQAIQGQGASTVAAQKAYAVASAAAAENGMTVRPDTFLVYQDGTVKMTVEGYSTSVLLGRFKQTDDLTKVSSTVTVRYGDFQSESLR
jgi:hypothetical protein